LDLQLSPRQRATIAAGLTVFAVAVIVAAIGYLFWVLGRFFQEFSNVFLPLAVAGILALVMNPYFEWLRARMPSGLAVVLLFLSVLIPMVAFLWYFGDLIVQQVSELIDRAPEIWTRAVAVVQERWPQVMDFLENNPWGRRLREAAEGQGESVVEGFQRVGAKAFTWGAAFFRGVASLFAWAVLPVYFVFFLLADQRQMPPLENLFPFLKAETRRDLVFLIREFLRIVVTFFRGQLIIAFLMGVLFAVGFSAVGLRFGFVLGLVLGFLNVIPYLGSIVGLTVALPLALFQDGGGWWMVGAVLGVFTVVQMIEAYLLTPKIMGDRTGLHPMAVIVAVFFWGTALDGIMGMILAIPLTAFLVVLWRLGKERYFTELL
jgi:predicted PurR-regulated permease PerM